MKQLILKKLIDDEIGLNTNCDICKKNNNTFTSPFSPYLIADNSTNPKDRIMFVGKVARGDGIGDICEGILEDVTSFGEKYFRSSSWAFYSYTNEIVEKYYGDIEKAIKHISFSNMVKCNNETMNDTTNFEAKISCIEKNQFIWKEIHIIKPKRIIFYTHYDYDYFIRVFKPNNFSYYKDIKDEKYRIKVGNKTSLYWHREFYDNDHNLICSFLRVSHPMMKNRNDYVNAILHWLKETE